MRHALAVAFVLVLVLVLVPSVACAEGFLELLGGVAAPLADTNWTNNTNTSPKLAAHGGAINEQGLGGMVAADWTPVNLNKNQFGGLDVAGHRFRILAEFAGHKRVAPKLVASGRAGLGIDIAHASATITILGVTASSSDTDTGFTFELGGGLWYEVGGVQIGGELALPIGHHGKQGNNTDGNYKFDYTSFDLDVLVGVRLTSR